MSNLNQVTILLVEDNPGDIFLFREALYGFRLYHDYQLETVINGRDAMRFLRREEPYGHVPLPDIIVLDINIPIKSGREVFMEIISDQELKKIPIAILTTSVFDRDLCDLHPEGLCTYYVKKNQFELLQEIVVSILSVIPASG